MKLKAFLMASLLVALTILAVGTVSSTSADASSWNKGIPSFLQSKIDYPWVSHKRSGSSTDKNGTPTTYAYVLVTNNQLGTALKSFYHNGKPNNTIPEGWDNAFPDPYYQKLSQNTYMIRSNVSRLRLIKIKKLSSKEIQVWFAPKAGNQYWGKFTKMHLTTYVNENPF